MPFDDRLIEFGWSFRNDTNNPTYDGVKVTFLYNTEHTNDPTKKGYSRNFILNDLHGPRLDIATQEPIMMLPDSEFTHFELVPYRSRKVCLDRGQCAFIAGFKR